MDYLSGPFSNNPWEQSYWIDPNSLVCTDPAVDNEVTQKVKDDVNKASANVTPNNTVAVCPLMNSAVPPATNYNPKNTKCNFSSIRIFKPERKYDLIITPDSSPTGRVMAVTAGFKNAPAKVIIELQGPVGPCSETHIKKRSFDTGYNKLKILPESTENKLAVELVSSSRVKIFPWGVTTNNYSLSAIRCGHGKETATIEVYPDTEADVTVTWNFGEESKKIDTRKKVEQKKAGKMHAQKGVGIEKTTTAKTKTIALTKGLEISGNIKYDGLEQSLEATFHKTIETLEKISEIVERAHKALSIIKKGKEEAQESIFFDSPVSTAIKWPNVGLGIGGAWIEEEGKPTVAYQATIIFQADPIIGFEFEWDITQTILQNVPGGFGISTLLKKLRTDVLKLVIKAGAEVSGSVEIDIVHKKIQNVTGKVEGKVPVSAELTAIKFEKKVWKVTASIEFAVGVEGGFKIIISFESKDEVLLCEGGFLDFVIWVHGSLDFDWDQDSDENTYRSKTEEKTDSSREDSLEGKHVLYKKEFEKDLKKIFRYDFKNQ
jgi:hypothetical protein